MSTLTEKEMMDLLRASSERIAMGRAIVKKRSPYIASTLYGLVFRPVWGDDDVTMAVTPGLVCYFNPEWLMKDPELAGKDGAEIMAGDIFHECFHPLQGFDRLIALRKRGLAKGFSMSRSLELSNIASDIWINNMARRAGYKLQDWVCYPERFGLQSNLLMEENWQGLVAILESQKDDFKGINFNLPFQGGCTRHNDENTPNTKAKRREVELDQTFGRSALDIDRIRRTTAQDMAEHETRRGRGSATGFQELQLNFKKEKPLVRWETELRHVLRACTGNIMDGDDDYDMMRVDKQSMLLGIPLPGLVDQEPEIVIIRDTSASVSDRAMNYANNEAVNAMRSIGVDTVWLIDADVQTKGAPRRVNINALKIATVRGRGGTSFVQPLAAITKLTPRPSVAIYFTDGDGEAPPKPPPGIQVIWCILPSRHRNLRPAPWGHVIVCSNDRAEREAYGRK